jgi:circadian clock protein KaiC
MTQLNSRVSTGVTGLDEILYGGFLAHRSCLVRGGPGSGKTTLGLHFLAAGTALGEKSLFISLEESEARIREDAEKRGIDIQQVVILDISPSSQFFTEVQSYDIFSSAEVEHEPLINQIVEKIKELQPDRVFLDPMTQFRYLSVDTFQFRKQAMSFLRFLVEQGCTLLFTSEKNVNQPDDELQFTSDGIIDLDGHNRILAVTKLRGSGYHSGTHTFKLSNKGFEVFPLLLPNSQQADFTFEQLPSGIPDLDELLNGGIERGTITILSGPSGVGKTTLGMQIMKEAAGRGELSIIYSFEEEEAMIVRRCDSIGIPVSKMIEKGFLLFKKIEPLQYTPDEFARMVREEVESNKGNQIVMIDSVAGFTVSLRGDELKTRLHALCKYLQNMGVAVIIINEVESVTGDFRITEAGISYLADNVIFLRYIEVNGELRRAIGVIKKRLSDFEKTLREFEITRYGIRIGKPLVNLRGILRGTPEYNTNDKT